MLKNLWHCFFVKKIIKKGNKLNKKLDSMEYVDLVISHDLELTIDDFIGLMNKSSLEWRDEDWD